MKKFNRSSSKEQTKPVAPCSSKNKHRLLIDDSPSRYCIAEKRDLNYRSLNKGKCISKTPKHSNHTVMDVLNDNKFRERPRSHLKISHLDHSLSPKRMEGAFSIIEKSFHSSKAAQKELVFTRDSESKDKDRDRENRSKKEDLKPVSPLNRDVKKRHVYTEFYNCQNDLTDEEYKSFGDRFPLSFIKIGLLGRGGFSLVWLGIQKKSKRRVAIKQILSKNPHQTHLKEIWFGGYFFNQGGEPREEFASHPGINNICGLLTYEI